jgi:hypothetical protein
LSRERGIDADTSLSRLSPAAGFIDIRVEDGIHAVLPLASLRRAADIYS